MLNHGFLTTNEAIRMGRGDIEWECVTINGTLKIGREAPYDCCRCLYSHQW